MFRENASMQEILTLNRKEQTRLMVLNEVKGKKLTMEKAAALPELSPHHTWRLFSVYRKEGASVLAHGNRGKDLPML
jgi:hypothetical protein